MRFRFRLLDILAYRKISEAVMRLSRIVPLLIVVSCLTFAPLGVALADDATPTTQSSLVDQVDTFWHYGKIARYDLAADAASKLLSADPRALLEAFEAVTARRGDNMDQWLLRWRTMPVPSEASVKGDSLAAARRDAIQKMRAAADKLSGRINLGYATRRGDPDFIRNTIIAMSQGSRGYDNNLPRLANSGELAVKVLVDILRSADDRPYHATARRALRDLGRKAINPLLAATEMKDNDTLLDVISALGDIGYEPCVPYLARLATSPAAPQGVRVAARRALVHLGITDTAALDPAQQFFDLAEKFYYNKSSVTPSGDATAYVWYWTDNMGLTKLDVPTPIFGDVMTMRCAEYALKLNPSSAAAVALWLAANTKREAELPEGSSDPTHAGLPDAHYYNVSAGVKYLNDALTRALQDRNTPVAFRLTASLQDIIGQSNMSAGGSEPLFKALYYPNRQVRYQAAFALAESLPTRSFSGSDRVVPLLASALSQSTTLNVLAVAPADQVAALRQAAETAGCTVVAAGDPTQAANAAMALPYVDLIIIFEDSDVGRMVALQQTTTHLQSAPLLVLTRSNASPYAVRSATDPLMSAVLMPPGQNLAATLKIEIPRALEHAGTPLMTEQQAADYARRAARLLSDLAISRNPVLDLAPAQSRVLAALNDGRPEIAQAAGNVLAMLDSQPAQTGLATKALDAQTAAPVRVSLFKSLVVSAKFFGNRLGPDKIAQIEQTVAGEKDPAIRSAAAEARGALNLPADQARALILAQSKM